MTTEEETEIRRLAASRKEPMRMVQRAQVIAAMLEDPRLAASRAGELAGFQGAPMGIEWVKHFNEKGLADLMDDGRSGRPATHSQEIRSKLLDLPEPVSESIPQSPWLNEVSGEFHRHENCYS